MRKTSALFVIILFFSLAAPAAPSLNMPSAGSSKPPVTIEMMLKKITSLKIKDLQKATGKKLTLKEKIGFLVLKHKLKTAKDEKSNMGATALIFGIAAIGTLLLSLLAGFFLIPSFIAAVLAIVLGSVAKKKNPDDRKALAGKLLGWITLGCIAALFILVVILISSLF